MFAEIVKAAVVLCAFVACVLFAALSFADEHTVTVTPPQRIQIEHALPADAPVAVVLVAQCGSAVGLYATMADGTLLAFDMSSGIPFKQQTEWANQAKRAITVDTKCLIAPGEFKD